MDTIACPHCGKDVELSEAIVHQLQEQVRQEEKKKLQAQFEKEKAEHTALKEKQLREEFENQNKEVKKELEERKQKAKELSERLAENEKLARLKEEKIKEEAQKEAAEKFRLDRLEHEKKLTQMQKDLENAQRKAKQGSQQLQGEVLELDLERKLKLLFLNDQFTPVPKGVEGGDIWQKVIFQGKVVGSILWETKRTKTWSKSWLVKLKDDAGRINASESIIVSQVLPEGVSHFDRLDGVWITSFEHAINICRYVRFLITKIASVKSSANQTDEEWGKVRDYMVSDAFKHRMQAHFDGINTLRVGLDAEKRATILRWKKLESVIEKLDSNTTNFYGELRAIVSDLPKVEGVDSVMVDDGNE